MIADIVRYLVAGADMRMWRAIGILSVTLAAPLSASAFDYSRYEPGDLDAMVRRVRPETGADIFQPRNYRLVVRLEKHAQECDGRFMKMAMKTVGIPPDQVDQVPISKCILVKSKGGNVVPMFIQNTVADFLAQEVTKDSAFTVYVLFVYVGPDGPGLLVNEFSTDTTPPTPSPT